MGKIFLLVTITCCNLSPFRVSRRLIIKGCDRQRRRLLKSSDQTEKLFANVWSRRCCVSLAFFRYSEQPTAISLAVFVMSNYDFVAFDGKELPTRVSTNAFINLAKRKRGFYAFIKPAKTKTERRASRRNIGLSDEAWLEFMTQVIDLNKILLIHLQTEDFMRNRKLI